MELNWNGNPTIIGILTLSLDAVVEVTAGEAGVFLLLIIVVVVVVFVFVVFVKMVGDDVLEFILFVAADLSFKLLLLLIKPPFSWWWWCWWSAFDVDADVSGLPLTEDLLLPVDGGGCVASVWFKRRLWSANKNERRQKKKRIIDLNRESY